MTTRSLIPLAASLALLAAAAPAGAADGALAPEDLTTAARADEIAALAQPSGAVEFAYTDDIGPVAALRPAGGPPGSAQRLTRSGSPSDLQLLRRPDGGTFAFWNGPGLWQFADRDAGELFAGSDRGHGPSSNPAAAIKSDGGVMATWASRDERGEDFVAFAERNPGSTTFANAVPLSAPFPNAGLQTDVAVGKDGTVAVAWRMVINSTTQSIRVRVRDPEDGTFDPINVIANGNGSMELGDVVVDDAGNATVSWVEGDAVKAANRATSGDQAFAPAFTVGAGSYGLSLKTDGSGAGVAAWIHEGADDKQTPMTARRNPNGTFAPAQPVAAPGDHRDAGVSLTTGGRYVVHWIDGSRGMARVGSGRPVEVARDVESFAAVIEPGGNVAALWGTPAGAGNVRVRTGGIDNGTPPKVGAVRVQRTTNVRESTHFSARASDWGGIARYEWRFGDGSSATGESVDHTYASDGLKTVELRVVDRAGNVTTERRQLFVEDPSERIHVLPPDDRARDTVAPTGTLKTGARIKRKAFLKGIQVNVTTDEPTSVDAELLGTARGVRLARSRYNVVLADAAAPNQSTSHALRFKPNRKLLGRAKKATVQLRVRLTDRGGNRTTLTKTIAVRK